MHIGTPAQLRKRGSHGLSLGTPEESREQSVALQRCPPECTRGGWKPTGPRSTVNFSLAAELSQGTPPGRTNVDRDQDGLPDTWELRYFGNLSQGPNDQTGGGVTNRDAYELGLVPDPIFVDGFEMGDLSRWH